MKKKIVTISIGIFLLGLGLLGLYQMKQSPQLGTLGYPSKKEIIRFYKNNKNALEYIQQTTSVIDNSFRIMSDGYVHWNYEGEDYEKYRAGAPASKEQEIYDENFKEGSRLLKTSTQLFDSKWINMIIGSLVRKEDGKEIRIIKLYNSYYVGEKEYEVGIMYIESTKQLQLEYSKRWQIYQDNHIEGNWYYFCQYKPTTKDTWRS